MHPQSTSKICRWCNQEKPLDEFYIDKRTGTSIPHCKACHHARRSPFGSKRTSVPIAERLWPRVTKVNDATSCWPWTGSIDRYGYGYLGEGGSVRNGAKYIKAHRVVWELTYGPIPNGLQVLHHCDDPQCCRPDHLFLGTNLDNAKDRHAKGRDPRGEKHGNAKLTDEAVREIRRRYAAGGISQQNLADEFGVNQTIVSDVVRRVYWQHVTDDPPP